MNDLVKLARSALYQGTQAARALRGGLHVRSDQWRTLLRLLIHPIDAMNDLKYEHKASGAIAALLAVLFFLEQLVAESATGYLFGTPQAQRRSIWLIMASTLGLLLLWGVCSWAACTLFDGEGRFGEILLMTAYALLPWVLLSPVETLLSNVISLDGSAVFSAVRLIGVGWTLLLVFLGMMVCQQFTVSKTVALTVVSLLGIAALLFLVLLFFSITQQMVGFVKDLITELTL